MSVAEHGFSCRRRRCVQSILNRPLRDKNGHNHLSPHPGVEVRLRSVMPAELRLTTLSLLALLARVVAGP